MGQHCEGEGKHNIGALLLMILLRWKRGLGVFKRMRIPFFTPSPVMFIDCLVHRKHLLMFSFHVSALVHGCRKDYCKLICLLGLCWEWTPITVLRLVISRLLCHCIISIAKHQELNWLIPSILHWTHWWACCLMIYAIDEHFLIAWPLLLNLQLSAQAPV